jgi:hypothetical protein
MTTPKPRLAVLLTHPVQYFKPVFTGLAADSGLELMVVFGCDHGTSASVDPDFGVAFAWDSAPTEGFPHAVVSDQPLAALSNPASALGLARQADIASVAPIAFEQARILDAADGLAEAELCHG